MNNVDKFDDVLVFSERLNEDIDIIVLGETWIHSNNTVSFQIKDFHSIFSCRDDRPGGGLAIFVRKNLHFNILQCDDGRFPFQFICIELPEYKSTQLWSCYRPPNSGHSWTLAYFLNF